jgi:peptide/nickel transport system permease protein
VLRFTATRIGWALIVVLGTATVAFVMLRVVPGNPVTLIMNGGPAEPQVEQAITAQFHLSDPLIVQYFLYLDQLLHGSLGISIANGQSVASQIGAVLPSTLILVAAAMLIGLAAGIGAGVASAWTRWPVLDRALTAGYAVLASLPGFWVALLLLTAFSFHLGWFPAAGNSGFGSVVLPAVTLALPVIAIIGQLVRDGMKEVLTEPYILAARAKGVSQPVLLIRHALRNALVPALTASAVIVGSLITGAVIAEQVFAREGIGELAVNAITHKDYPLVQGVVLVVAVAFVVLSVTIDIGHALLDPRVR